MEKLIEILHNGKIIKFSSLKFPRDCRGDYMSLKTEIESYGLKTPTISEIVSLAHSVLMNPSKKDYNYPIYEEYREREWKLHHLLYAESVEGFTGCLTIPGKGVYIKDYPILMDNKIEMNKDKLSERLIKENNGVLYSEDNKVRFVPWDNIPVSHPEFSSKKNSLLIALVGEEGKNKLSELITKYSLYGFIHINKKLKKPTLGCTYIHKYGIGDGRPSNIPKDFPGSYLYNNSVFCLGTSGQIDSRPFSGIATSFGISL